MEAWSGFFIAQVGASAALTGLIFVSVSLSLARIIATPHLPMRAFQAMLVLLEILVVSSLAIVPQPLWMFGRELVAVAAPLWILIVFFDHRSVIAARLYSAEHTEQGILLISRAVGRVILSQIAALSFAVAGIAILMAGLVGVFWLVPAIICSYLVAMTDAWVLLIEINR